MEIFGCGKQKICYPDRKAAVRGMDRITRLDDGSKRREVYWCAECAAFHVGYKRPKRRARRPCGGSNP